MVIQPSGFWQTYQYDSNQLVTNITSQFLNAVTNAAANLCRVDSYYYAPINGALFSQTAVETLLGQEVARTYYLTFPSEAQIIRCQTAGASWNAANNLVTTINYVATGPFAGNLQNQINPDGTVTSYQYTANGTTSLTTTVSTGQPDSTGTNVALGTQTITVVDQFGQMVSNIVVDIASGFALVTDTYSSYDYLDRPTQVTHLDGTTETTDYACCGISSTVDRAGTATTYAYDALKRQIGSTLNSITTSNTLDAAGNVLATTRTGTDSSQILQSQTAYDHAGRVILQTNSLLGVTSTTNTFDGSGQSVLTVTNPDGGTSITTYAQDGNIVSVSGTAVRPMNYLYGVDSNGYYTTAVALSATNGTNEWTKTYADPLGRQYKTIYASASGSPSSTSYFNNLGQLIQQVDPDGVSTLYGYNGKGEQAFTVVDVNTNGVIDFGGPDRITFTTNDVVTDNSTHVQRSQTFVWSTSANASNLISTVETSADGLRTWSTVWNAGVGVTTQGRTVYNSGSGFRYLTNTAPDGSYSVAIYQNGRLISQANTNAGGVQINQTSFGYDAHGRQSTSTDVRNGTTTYSFNYADQIISIVTPIPATGQSAETTMYYIDSLGRTTNTTLPDSTSVTNVFYPTGDIKLTCGSRMYPVGYNYDYQGRMLTMTNWTGFAAGYRGRGHLVDV